MVFVSRSWKLARLRFCFPPMVLSLSLAGRMTNKQVHFAKEYSDVYDVAFGSAAGKTEGDGERGVSPVPPTQ